MAATPQTGALLKALLEDLIDESLDDTLAYNLLTLAKDKREASRQWEFLKKYDGSKTWSVGDTYLSTKALPSDFMRPHLLYVGSDQVPYDPVPFEQREFYQDVARTYYIDYASGTFAICGSAGTSQTIKQFYFYATDDIASGATPVWPVKFQRLLAFDAAGIYQMGVDADDIYARMSPENKLQARLLEAAMINDDEMKKSHSRRGMVNQTPRVGKLGPLKVDLDA